MMCGACCWAAVCMVAERQEHMGCLFWQWHIAMCVSRLMWPWVLELRQRFPQQKCCCGSQAGSNKFVNCMLSPCAESQRRQGRALPSAFIGLQTVLASCGRSQISRPSSLLASAGYAIAHREPMLPGRDLLGWSLHSGIWVWPVICLSMVDPARDHVEPGSQHKS